MTSDKYKVVLVNAKEVKNKLMQERSKRKLSQIEIDQLILSEAKCVLKPTLSTSLKKFMRVLNTKLSKVIHNIFKIG